MIDLGLNMVVISMMVMCNASVITEHDRRSELPSAPNDLEYGNKQ